MSLYVEAIDRLELMRGPTAAEEDEVVVMDEAGASQQQGVAGRRAGAEGDEMAPVAGPLPPSAAAGAAATAADAAPSAAAPAMPPESTGPACAPTVSAPSPVVALEPTTGWGGLEEADPFSLEQPLLAFEALMDGIGGDDDDGGGHGGHCGVGAHLPLLVDEEAEQPLPSAGPTSAASSSSSAAIGAKEESGGSSRAIAAEEEGGGTAREEKKTNGEAASTMLGAAAVASVSDGGAGGGGQQKEGEASMAAPGSENAANLPPTADVHRDEPPEAQPPLKKKRKINAAHLAITTLALAAGIQEGRAVTGLVREAEYEDIHDVFMDKLHPDPDYGEDEDLCLR